MKFFFFQFLFLFLLSGSVFAVDDFVSEDDENADNTASNNFILDVEDSGGDVQLQFGSTLSEFLQWNDTLGDFVLSDTLRVGGNIDLTENELTFDVDNVSGGADVRIIAGQGSDDDGEIRYNSTTNEWEFSNDGTVFTPIGQATVTNELSTQIEGTAQAFTDNLEAQLVARGGVEGGNLGQTPLFVLNTTDGKAQITSLEDGNECVAYLTGMDFSEGDVLERVFLRKGEIYIFENLIGGSIINCLQGAYGFSGQRTGNNESPMPLGTLGLSFTDTFFFAFRDSSNAANDLGLVYIANGPVASTVSFRTGAGALVDGQTDVVLDPFEFHIFHTAGNIEYRLTSDNPIVAGINAQMSALDGSAGQFYDSRLIMPLTNDAITWPRSGQMSALFDNTQVDFWVRDGVEGRMNSTAGTGISPGSPVDMDAAIGVGTGANDADYEPNGATRFRANGVISGFSGADSSGLEATPLWPVDTFVQRVALPLAIQDAGDGGNNGVAISSIYEGTARVFEWDPVLEEAVLVYTIPITRNIGGTNTRDDQNHPAAGLLSPNAGEATTHLVGEFYGGYVEADVPIHVVFNSEQNQNQGTAVVRRGTSGASVIAINSDDDEQATTGITPNEFRNETREDANGILRKRVIDGGGNETWVIE